MQKKTLKLGVTVAALSCLGLGSVAISSIINKKNELSVNAATPQTTRRIWAVDNTDGGWFVGDKLYCYTFSNSANIEMTQVLSDFRGGLFYCDISSSETGMLFRDQTANWDNAYQKTDNVTITGHENDIYYINQNSGGTCPVSEGSIKLDNASQLSVVMSYYATCDSSYSYGYNACPLLINSIYGPNMMWNGTAVYQGNREPNAGVTVLAKVSEMYKLYQADQGAS
jgi:hypothetical protein